MAEPNDKFFLPERKRSLEQLMEGYTRLEGNASKADVSLRERTVADPLGLNEKINTEDRANAKEVVVRMVKFFALCSEEYALDAKSMVYAAELVGVNILNAQDIPLTAKEIQIERDAAVRYYEESLPKIPAPQR